VGGNPLSVIRTSDNTVVDTVFVSDLTYGVAVTPDGNYVYVANFSDDTVSVIESYTAAEDGGNGQSDGSEDGGSGQSDSGGGGGCFIDIAI
jgi:DNA-binding beta-propeller fold protein YncE